MRVRRQYIYVIWNIVITTIQVWWRRWYAVFWVRRITFFIIITSIPATTAASITLTTYAISITIKTMRIASYNFEIVGGNIVAIQIRWRTLYICQGMKNRNHHLVAVHIQVTMN